MSYLHFGTDIRIENLMLLDALSMGDAEVIYDNLDELAGALAEDGVAIPVDEFCDSWEVREFFEERGVTGVFGFVCTPVPEMSRCGKYIGDLSWGYYARFPVYGKDIGELKEKAIEKVAAYRKKKISEQEGALDEDSRSGIHQMAFESGGTNEGSYILAPEDIDALIDATVSAYRKQGGEL